MPDTGSRNPLPPASWGEAFAALPLEAPPRGGWDTVAARLDARRRSRAPLWLATAAALLLAIALPWRLYWTPQDPAPARPWPDARALAADPMEALYAESAQLEALLAVAQDDRYASGTALALSGEFASRLASIDAALMQPGLSYEQRHALWQQRVDSLRALTGFESNRRWLAAQGTRYDGALVHVD